MHRLHSQRPYTHACSSDMLFEAMAVSDDKTITLSEKVREDVIAAITTYKQVGDS